MEHLQSPENSRFHRRSWVIERAAWGVLAAIVTAAALGAFGKGPLSSAERAVADGTLTLAYQRFVRVESPTELRVVVDPALALDGRFALWLSADYLAGFRTDAIEPEPERTELGTDRTTFYFVTSAEAPTAVRFYLVAEGSGPASGTVGTASARLAFEQFVYP